MRGMSVIKRSSIDCVNVVWVEGSAIADHSSRGDLVPSVCVCINVCV